MARLSTCFVLYFCTSFSGVNGFIPHPAVGVGARSNNSITHTEITALGFIRSLARYFYDTRFAPENKTGLAIDVDEYFVEQHTIDSLYELAHPEYNAAQLAYYSLPLKFALDWIMVNNALVDFASTTKHLSAAHFDSEAFMNGSRRILTLRDQVVADARSVQKNLTDARQKLGKLLHTLQDFYSHSNWIEMGKTGINDLIGRNETIGTVAAPTQATCSDSGCTEITRNCVGRILRTLLSFCTPFFFLQSWWQKITLRKCPLVYYDCANNILPEINQQQLLTSGYLFNQISETNEPVTKPINISKCSHGSVLDDSTHVPGRGGINKDSNSLLFSPHSNLHFEAVEFAVNATERFLNDLRADIGDVNFDRLFAIHPTESHAQAAANEKTSGRRFRFFSSLLSTSLKKKEKARNKFKHIVSKIKSTWHSIFSKNKTDAPTYSLGDQGVNIQDANNVHAIPSIIENDSPRRKKRFLDALHRRPCLRKRSLRTSPFPLPRKSDTVGVGAVRPVQGSASVFLPLCVQSSV